MKVKLSKVQWEQIGKLAGWANSIKTSEQLSKKPEFHKKCPHCQGNGCEACGRKGYFDQADLDSYYHSVLDTTCPHCNEGKTHIKHSVASESTTTA